ncbi:PepSY domain-containing protein, partial [Pseudomonas urethralis]|uniref:PepSY domain-containing protein n=1 Tax=Pseudomonas urethralis TaxID=2740517 RepID=UPI001596FAF3
PAGHLPPAGGQPAHLFHLLEGSAHPLAFNPLVLHPASGQVKRQDRYRDKPFKAHLLQSVYALHVGDYFGLPCRIIVTLASLTMPLFFV